MDKVTNYVGIDISNDTFDVLNDISGHEKFSNIIEGFKSFYKTLNSDSCCVMEATGCYHQKLAMFLYEKGVSVAVINPLVIKRFIQMKLQHTKTDKSDAMMIAQYAKEQSFELWQPRPEYLDICKAMHSAINLYFKQSTALKNNLHSLEKKGLKAGKLARSLRRQLKHLKKEIDLLEKEMEELIKIHEPEMFSNIASIPGIGKKTAMLLISSTNGFMDFSNYKQVSSYFGLAPTERSSGSSIRGHSRISKTGNPKVRNHLFMCSFTACVHNAQCKALYDRIVAKGKSKKLALIAVTNKLIKQSFAIAKSGLMYDENYKSQRILINYE